MKSIAFFYPSKNVGGAQLLFARLAVELAAMKRTVIVVDFKDGFVSNYVRERGSAFVFYEYYVGQVCVIKEEVCLIQHLSSFPTLQKNIRITDDSTLLFWSIHPYNIYAFYRLTPVYTRVSEGLTRWITKCLEPFRRKTVKRWLHAAEEVKGLYFMDGSNWETINTMFDAPFQPSFLPIPIEDKSEKKQKYNKGAIHVAWIGRVSDAKVYPFENVVERLDKSGWDEKIVFHIIGFGDTKCIQTVKNIEVVDHGIVKGQDLNNLLVEKIDVVIAMGTALMEAAALGIPSVLTDLSKSRIPDNYKFKWLFESTNYDLGTSAEKANGSLSVLDILNTMSDEEGRLEVGRKCKEYVQKNHNINSVVEKVIKAVEESTLQLKDLR